MNILRWKRKSKKKINFKSLILVIFSLIMTTFAWFAYSKVLDTTLNMHVASWDMEYYIGEVKKTNPIGIEFATFYPTMEEQVVTIDIKNNGETLVDIEYNVESVTIAGTTYEIVEEGETNTSQNYIALSSPLLHKITTTDEETETTIVEYIYKGAITNDITKFPFTIEIEHSAQVDPVDENDYGVKVSGEGYLKVTVNWIGDNHELDSEWGYIVGEYFENNPDATSAMSIQLSIDSYQADGLIQDQVHEMPSKTTTAPYLPAGFYRVPGTNLDNGLVITDNLGNEYVWIEVPKTASVYENAGLNVTEYSTTDYENIEKDLKAYSAAFRTRDDAYTAYKTIGLSEDNYNILKQKMLKSIYRNGGFYIGRYETGIADSFRTTASTSDPTETPVIKANAYPYNYVTCSQAQTVATKLAIEGYQSNLMFGVQWDLVLKYLETKGIETADLNTDSTTWGNYKNNEYDITRQNAKYSIDNGTTWLEPTYSKYEGETTILTTGANSGFCKQNIYDLAGNLAEWTFSISYGTLLGGHGGDYLVDGTTPASSSGSYDSSAGAKQVGFRVSLFVDEGTGAETDPGLSGDDEVGAIKEITLDKTTGEVALGSTLSLTATVNAEATDNIIWTSSNTSVATVTGSGDNNAIGIVTPISEGTTVITARNASRTVLKTCTVTVTEEVAEATGPYMPTGFSLVSEATATTGYTIKDGSNNQYVWVEVPKTAEVYPTAGLSITEFTETELGTIETDLHTYTATYRNSTSHTDTWYSSAQHGFASADDYNALKYKMLKSVYQNGGFYVGKYETGIADSEPDVIDTTVEGRTAKGDTTQTPVIQANAYPYNFVTCSQAQSLASGMASGEYTSSLMFGVQWDLVLKYLETKAVEQGTSQDTIISALNSDSTSWGNYYDNIYNITNTSAKNYVSAWTDGTYNKTSSSSVLLSTGASDTFSKQGIYDLAGNVYEWTLEYTSYTSDPCAIRGGSYNFYGSYYAAGGRDFEPISSNYCTYIGFRVTLY